MIWAIASVMLAAFAAGFVIGVLYGAPEHAEWILR